MRLVLVDGMRGAGKSSLIAGLVDVSAKWGWSPKVCDFNDFLPRSEYGEMSITRIDFLLQFLELTNGDDDRIVFFDRMIGTEFVYNQALDRGASMSDIVTLIRRWNNLPWASEIILTATKQAIIDRVGRDRLEAPGIRRLWKVYSGVQEHSCSIDTTDKTRQEALMESLTYLVSEGFYNRFQSRPMLVVTKKWSAG